MDKLTAFVTINSMLGKKHKFTLSFSEETRALICNSCDTEQMHHIMSALYSEQNTGEDFVKKNIADIKGEVKRTIGFGVEY